MKNITFSKPSVLRMVPGLYEDTPVVVLFDSYEDAHTYWLADDSVGPDGYNWIFDANIIVPIYRFDKINVVTATHEQVVAFVERTEQRWRDEVCYRYPTEEEKHERYIQWLEDTGNIVAYYESMSHNSGDPFYDSDDELYNKWCMKNNLAKNDFEAIKYKEYYNLCYYCHDEPELDENDYCDWVEDTLEISHDINRRRVFSPYYQHGEKNPCKTCSFKNTEKCFEYRCSDGY